MMEPYHPDYELVRELMNENLAYIIWDVEQALVATVVLDEDRSLVHLKTTYPIRP